MKYTGEIPSNGLKINWEKSLNHLSGIACALEQVKYNC